VKRVSIITGGAGGMGLATAKILGSDHSLVLCDLNQNRLDLAVNELSMAGIEAVGIVTDVTDRNSVNELIVRAQSLGNLVSLVHTAGISPQMAGAEQILRVNVLGTVNIVNAMFDAASEGFVLVNVASMAGHMLPEIMIPRRTYRYAFSASEKLIKKLLLRCKLMPTDFYRRGIAYSISKNFVMWFSRENAARYGAKGARILSISPGIYDTEMGKLEEQSGGVDIAMKSAALKRVGRPDEIAELLAFCATTKAGYLTGVDILADGGVIAGRKSQHK
tara:strand:+ start:1203 stop:2030 length:828 start_codon:yes stop_codon:yes gene_type:complete